MSDRESMGKIVGLPMERQGLFSEAKGWVSRRWEELFFLVLLLWLRFQALAFVGDAQAVFSSLGRGVALFFAFETFVVEQVAFVAIPLFVCPLIYLIAIRSRSLARRRFLDVVGLYIVLRMFVQLIGMNLLVFDFETPGSILITQLLLFLPYSMLAWGWIYWRLDMFAAATNRTFFRLDCERNVPRPIDYLVASLSSVFSATIPVIKGRSARARLLILVHGFFVYDLMGLTLSRAVALVQAK